ncbi:MAG TPA: hypothetical protein G4O11_03010 [Anaerolineae bacterium]|nr:hypothetical protein [Anaerolineae bacterium]
MGDIAGLRATVEMFCRFIEGSRIATVAEQAWGPKEVLAHLVFHHESYIDQVKALRNGELFEPPRGRFSDLNAQAVVDSRGVSVQELIRRFLEANETLCNLYKSVDPHAIVLEIKLGAKLRTFAELIPEVEAHIRNHQRILMRELRCK